MWGKLKATLAEGPPPTLKGLNARFYLGYH